LARPFDDVTLVTRPFEALPHRNRFKGGALEADMLVTPFGLERETEE